MIKMTREIPNAFNQTEIMVDEKEVEAYKKNGWKVDVVVGSSVSGQNENQDERENSHANKKNKTAKENADDKKDLF